MLRALVALSAVQALTMLRFLPVAIRADGIAGARGLPMMEGCRVRVTPGTPDCARVFLHTRVARGATGPADRRIGDALIMYVVVTHPVEGCSGVATEAGQRAKRGGRVAAVAGLGYVGIARMGVGLVADRALLRAVRLLSLVLMTRRAGCRRLLIDVVVVGSGVGAVAQGARLGGAQVRGAAVACSAVRISRRRHGRSGCVAGPAGAARRGLAGMTGHADLVRR